MPSTNAFSYINVAGENPLKEKPSLLFKIVYHQKCIKSNTNLGFYIIKHIFVIFLLLVLVKIDRCDQSVLGHCPRM